MEKFVWRCCQSFPCVCGYNTDSPVPTKAKANLHQEFREMVSQLPDSGLSGLASAAPPSAAPFLDIYAPLSQIPDTCHVRGDMAYVGGSYWTFDPSSTATIAEDVRPSSSSQNGQKPGRWIRMAASPPPWTTP